MPNYYFRTLEQNGGREVHETAVDLPDEAAAIAEARIILGEMAGDGLPHSSINMMSVEVLDEHLQPLIEVRLTVEDIPKPHA
ncbi:hypothetical protein LJR030_002954 [Rhizobium sp. LjRoot30]|uniref:DUF6894 family protein n=1 Tax=Rhizobium sp. LjRoot30 TaxID=3342320 RepID=UPI003ECF6AD7